MGISNCSDRLRIRVWKTGCSNLTRLGKDRRRPLTKGVETRSLYRKLARNAPPTYERRTGSMELRGAYRGLTMVIGLDDWAFCPNGGAWLVGNTIAV
jgi:hypothetical protein